jgi:hypothetical protein
MHHQFVGRPIGTVKNIAFDSNNLGPAFSVNAKFGPGVLWDSRVSKIIDAIRAGEIEGEVYSDGEVWADPQSVTGFLARQIPA